MPASRARREFLAAAALIWFAVLPLTGCTKSAPFELLPNQRPTIEVTQAPVRSDQPFFYGYELRWAGFDEDGSVDYFRYAVDPPPHADSETTWVSTRDNRRSFLFRSDEVDTLTDKTAEGFHTIVLEAVDDRGAASAPVYALDHVVHDRAHGADHPSPCRTTCSRPCSDRRSGSAGEARTRRPRLRTARSSTSSSCSPRTARVRLHHPAREPGFAAPPLRARTSRDWDSVGGDTTAVNFPRHGAEQEVRARSWSRSTRWVRTPRLQPRREHAVLHRGLRGLLGPKFTVYNESFFYTFPSGGFSLDPATFVRTEAAADRPSGSTGSPPRTRLVRVRLPLDAGRQHQ
jgi:hypothetical protein